METNLFPVNRDINFNSALKADTEDSIKIGLASKKAPTKKPDAPRKSIWASALFGLASGVLSFFINVLPEKIGQYLSQVFSSMVKTENPFIKEAE